MDEFGLRLKMLIDILDKKWRLLSRVTNIVENQGTILKSADKTKETLEIFRVLTEEKQKVIDEIFALDSAFNTTYDKIKHNFDNKVVTNAYRQEISQMQGYIKDILIHSENITIIEKSNDQYILEDRFKQTTPVTPKTVGQTNLFQNGISNGIAQNGVANVIPQNGIGQVNMPQNAQFTGSRAKSMIEKYKKNIIR